MRLTRILAVALPFVVAATLALPAAATQPQELRVALVGHVTGPNSAAGTWSSTGSVADAGTYNEVFRFVGNSIHVVKILVGSRGTIVLRVQAVVEWLNACTATFNAGSWQIVEGTGDYESLQGGGEPGAEPGSTGDICTGQILITHAGQAHAG